MYQYVWFWAKIKIVKYQIRNLKLEIAQNVIKDTKLTVRECVTRVKSFQDFS